MAVKSSPRAATIVSGFLCLFIASTIFAQQFSRDDSSEETTAKLVCQMVEQYHISHQDIDDKTSSKLLDKFIRDLDPQKIYFYQSDIDQLNEFSTKLDDMVKQGNVQFAYDTFNLHRKRVEERIAIAQELIEQDYDFNGNDSIVADADDLTWAKDNEEMTQRWRRRIKYNLLSLKISDVDLEEARERLQKRYRSILRATQQTEDHEILEMFLTALTNCFDPHSSYMSPHTLEDFQINMRLSLDGIGAALRSDDGFTVVAQIVPGGAADKDGRLAVGDKIIGVGQETGEIEDIVEMKLDRVVRLIRGPRGTKVRLQVKTAENGDVKLYEMTRQKIELKSAEVKGEVIETKDRIGRASRIGVVKIPSFYRDFAGAQQGLSNFKSTAVDLKKVLADFRNQNVDAVIVDLRTNGGGALSEAIEVSGLFIDEGPVVQIKQQSGRVKSHDDVEAGTDWDGPLVVVCNRLSASASEIFAGVIKDYRRGIIVGDTTTHGKGTVQNVMPVSAKMFRIFDAQDRGAVKLTIQQFYRVNGHSTQNLGVPSDVVLPSLIDHMDIGEAFLDNALAFDRIPQASFKGAGNLVNAQIITTLKERSKSRIDADPEFQKIEDEILKYLEEKSQKRITLNETKLREQRKDEEDEKKDEDDEEEILDEDKPVLPEGAYNDELLNLTVDYLELLHGLNTAQN